MFAIQQCADLIDTGSILAIQSQTNASNCFLFNSPLIWEEFSAAARVGLGWPKEYACGILLECRSEPELLSHQQALNMDSFKLLLLNADLLFAQY